MASDIDLELERMGFTVMDDPSPSGLPDPVDYSAIERPSFLSELPEAPAVSSRPSRAGRRSRASLELERDFINQQQADQPGIIERVARGDGPFGRADDYLSYWDRAMLGLGQAGGMLESQLGGLRAFVGDAPQNPMVRAAGRLINPASQALAEQFGNEEAGLDMVGSGQDRQREYVDAGEMGAPGDVGGEVVQDLVSQATASAAPSIAAGMFGGVPLMVAAAAGQTAGSVMGDAVDGFERQGYSREDSIRMARPIAAITGAITAGLTALMPGGTEALVGKLASGTIARGTARNLVFEIAKEALKEFPEEFADQLSQDIAARWTYRPDMSWQDIIADAFQAGSMGAAIGLGVGGVGAVAQHATGRRSAPPLIDVEPVSQPAINEIVQEANAGSQQDLSNPVVNEPEAPVASPVTLQDVVEAPVVEQSPQPAPAPDRGLVAPQAEMPFADNEFQLTGDLAEDPERIVREAEQAQADRAESEKRQTDMFAPAAPKRTELEQDLLNRYGVDTKIEEGEKSIRISGMTVPEGQRGQGVGSQVLSEIKTYADQHGKQVTLTATAESPEQQARLENFYERNGFVKFGEDPLSGKPFYGYQPTTGGETNGQKETEVQTQTETGVLNEPTVNSTPSVPSASSVDTAPAASGVSRARRQRARVLDRREPIAGPKSELELKKAERPPDIIDDIAGLAKIKPHQKGAVGKIAEYADLLQQAQAVAPELFDKVKGEDIDKIPQTLEAFTGKPWETEKVLNAIIQAGQRRQSFEGAIKKEVQKSQFEKVVIEGERTAKDPSIRRAKELNIDEVAVEGAQLKAVGQQFEVTDVEYRDPDKTEIKSVTLSDGARFGQQKVPAGTKIFVDKRSVKLPPEAKGPESGPGVDDAPFALESGKPIDSARVAQVWKAFVRSPLLKGVPTNEIQVEIVKGFDIHEGVAGRRLGNLIQLSEQADEKTLPHEMLHVVFDLLPKAIRDQIEVARVVAFRAAYKKLAPGVSPDPEILAGKLTSKQFVDGKFPESWYRFSNATEFFAHSFSDKFVQEFLERQSAGFVGRLKSFLKRTWRALSDALGITETMDRLYRDLEAGNIKLTPETGAALEEQFTFSKSAEDAANAAAFAEAQGKQSIEGNSQSAQGQDILGFLEKHGVSEAAPAVKQFFNLERWQGIADAGQKLLGERRGYRAVKESLKESWQKAQVAREAAAQWLRFDGTLAETIFKGQRAEAEMKGERMQERVAKLNDRVTEKRVRESNLKLERSVLRTALEKAKRTLKEEAKSDLEVAEMQGEIAAVEDAMGSSMAMERLLEDMTAKLASTPDGLKALDEGAAPRTIGAFYRAAKRAADEPVTNDNLIRWASYLLGRAPELRQQLHALWIAQNDTAALNSYQGRILHDLKKDPVKAIESLLKQREKTLMQQHKAEWAWHRLNKDVTRELAALQRVVDAGKMASAIKVDPEYQGLRTEVLKDFGYAGEQNPKPFQVESNAMFTNPNGQTVYLGNEVMTGKQSDFKELFGQMEKWVSDTENWLDENPDHPDWERFRLYKEVVQDYYYTHGTLNPNSKLDVFAWAMSVSQRVVDLIGGRMAAPLRKALSQWDRVYHASRRINDQATAELAKLQIAAMKSHDIQWGLRRQGQGQAARQYARTVLNELNASWQREGGGFEVGDVLESGQRVTKEDMALVEAQAKWAWQSIHAVSRLDQQLTADTMAVTRDGKKTFRHALQTVKYMMPRLFNYELGGIITPEYSAAWKNGDLDRVETFLDRAFPFVGRALVRDRNPAFAKLTDYDASGVLQEVADEMASGELEIHNMQELADAVADKAGMMSVEEDLEEGMESESDRDKVKETLVREFGRIVAGWRSAFDESEKQAEVIRKNTSSDTKNAFTQSRDMTIAPYAFYKVGFHNSDDVARFTAGMHSVARDRVADGLRAAIADLERQQEEFKTRVRQLENRGVANAEQKALEDRRLANEQGKNFDVWDGLQNRLVQAKKALDRMTSERLDDGFDYFLQRGAGDVVGALVKNTLTTLRNVSGTYLGRILRNMGMSWMKGTLLSAYHTMESAVKVAAAVEAELPYAFWRTVGNIPRAFRNDPGMREGGALRKLYNGMFRELIDGFSRGAPMRIKEIRDAVEAGVIHLPDRVTEFDNHVFGSLWSRGRIPSEDLKPMQKLLLSPLIMLFETGPMELMGSALPALGDLTANLAAMRSVDSALKGRFGLPGLETDLKKIHQTIQDGGRPFNFKRLMDPANRFIGKELGINDDTLAQRRRLFEQAGLDWDRKAAEYISRLNDGDTETALLTSQEIDLLKSTVVDLANRQAPSQSPLAFQESSKLAKFAAPLMGWPARTAAVWTQMLSIPLQSGRDVKNVSELQRARLQQLAYMATFVVLASLLAGGANKIPEELIARTWKKLAYNQETAARLPWEEEGMERKGWNFARMAMESVPFLSVIGNGVIPNNAPARASYTPSFVLLNVAEGVMNYINGVRATGDPTYRLNDFIMRMIPDSKVVLNRMDRFEGSRDRDNMVAQAKRFGPTDLVRPPYQGGATPNLTELTPFGRLLENYALTGDREKFVETWNAAVEKAKELGRDNPEKVVSQLFQGRNPITASFTHKLTAEQHQKMLEGMGPVEAEKFLAGEKAFQTAAEWVDARVPTFQKKEAAPAAAITPATEKRSVAQRLDVGEGGVLTPAAGKATAAGPFGSTRPSRSGSIPRGVSRARRTGARTRGRTSRTSRTVLRRSRVRPRRSASRLRRLA